MCSLLTVACTTHDVPDPCRCDGGEGPPSLPRLIVGRCEDASPQRTAGRSSGSFACLEKVLRGIHGDAFNFVKLVGFPLKDIGGLVELAQLLTGPLNLVYRSIKQVEHDFPSMGWRHGLLGSPSMPTIRLVSQWNISAHE